MRTALLVCMIALSGVLCASLLGCSGASAQPLGPRAGWSAPAPAAATARPAGAADNSDAAAAAFEAMGDLAGAPSAAAPEATPPPEGSLASSPKAAPAEPPKPAAEPNPADDPDGSLDKADFAAVDGRYYDAVAIHLQPAAEGQELRLRAAVIANAFVPCVGVVTADNPGGVWALPEGNVACAWIDVSGNNLADCTVVVTSGHPGQTGRYYLALTEGDGAFPAEVWIERTSVPLDAGQPEGDPVAPDWGGLQLPEGYAANWDTGIGPEQVVVFGIRPFSRDGRYMSLTGNVRFLHHRRTDVWMPRNQIGALLWLPRLSLAIIESVTKHPSPPAAGEASAAPSTTETPKTEATTTEAPPTTK